MPTIHLHQTTNLTSEQYVAGLTDFGPVRAKLFPNSADEYLTVHQQSRTEADVTEGSGGVWERLHYNWSDPNHVVLPRSTPIFGVAHPDIRTPLPVSPTARPILMWRWSVKVRTSRAGCSGSCSGQSAGAFWRRRFSIA